MSVPPAPYPAELERAADLRDGRRVRIRPIRPDDEARLGELYDRLGRETAYHRFFTVMKRLPPDWARFLANVDYRRRLALVAEDDRATGPLVAVARYEPTECQDTAEIAFVVQDGWQGQGLGGRLLDELLAAAEARGIHRFRAWVLPDNRRMLDLLARHTEVLERRAEAGVIELVARRARPTTASSPPR
ncbi:MAG: GNAT family N-acetyltransferase [Candidatus Rokubacteria bacterium]|nr:GNAT family N-acetyltransferase [Candidatus Rokubacteria bacterium]